MSDDTEHPYVYVVYRVDAFYLDGLQEKLAADEETAKRERQEMFDALQGGIEEEGAEHVLQEVEKRQRWRSSPWDSLIKVKEVFTKMEHAQGEVERLNLIARGKDHYFWQGANFYPNGRKAQKDKEKEDA